MAEQRALCIMSDAIYQAPRNTEAIREVMSPEDHALFSSGVYA